jgi:hypothetical protein
MIQGLFAGAIFLALHVLVQAVLIVRVWVANSYSCGN